MLVKYLQAIQHLSPSRRRVLRILLWLFLGVLAAVAYLTSNPLRRSEASIQQWVEEATPLGRSFEEVKVIATQRGWYDPSLQGSDGKTTGIYIRGELGDYQGFPFRTSVTVFWEFNANRRLEKVRIWKTVDGI